MTTVNIDQKFNPVQEQLIIESLNDWTIASSGVLQFRVNLKQPGYTNINSVIKPEDGIHILYVDKDDKELSQELFEVFLFLNGLYVSRKNGANILLFKGIRKDYFKNVALHEIGHMLGLEHMQGSGYVMSTMDARGCITYSDATALCKIYNCRPKTTCE